MLWLDIILISLLAFFAIGTVFSAYLYFANRLRRRGPKQWANEWEQQIQAEGYAGLQIKDHGEGDMLTMTWPEAGPKKAWLYLDTRHKLPRPEKADGFDTGIPIIDRFFTVRGATPAAVANLRANRHRLDGVVVYIEGWWSEHTSIRVCANAAEFSYRERRRGSLPPIPAKRLVTQLPQMAAFTKALLAAAWWAPPVARSAGSEEDHGAYRGGGGLPAAQWELEDPLGEPLKVDPIGPFDTEQMVQWLQQGRLTWLSRIRRVGKQTWQPMAEVAELQLVIPPPTQTTESSTQTAVGSGARIRRWLRSLAHRPSTYLVVMLAGFFTWPALSLAIAEYALGQVSSDWPRTPATITASEVVKTKAQTQTKSKGKPSKTKVTYRAKIRYTYEVGGQKHTGDRIQFGGDGSGEARARSLVQRYPMGSTVQVYYAPDHPHISTLETGSPSIILLGMVVVGIPGVLTLVLGFLLCHRRLRIHKGRRTARAFHRLAAV